MGCFRVYTFDVRQFQAVCWRRTEDAQHVDGRWKQHKTVLGKRVKKHHSAAIMSADLVDHLLVILIQRPKVDI